LVKSEGKPPRKRSKKESHVNHTGYYDIITREKREELDRRINSVYAIIPRTILERGSSGSLLDCISLAFDFLQIGTIKEFNDIPDIANEFRDLVVCCYCTYHMKLTHNHVEEREYSELLHKYDKCLRYYYSKVTCDIFPNEEFYTSCIETFHWMFDHDKLLIHWENDVHFQQQRDPKFRRNI